MSAAQDATEWTREPEHESLEMDTPIGKALLTKVATTGMWAARIDTESGVRQSQEFKRREEAESWVAQQVAEGQIMADTDPQG